METTTFHDRVREKMEERGISANALSAAVTDGRNRSYIRKMFETASDPGVEIARKIARELGVRIAWLIGEDNLDEAPTADEAIETVRIIGEVRASAFHESFEAPPSDQQVIRLLPDLRYPRIPRFGLKVFGHSVDLIAPNNSIVICSSFEILNEKLGRGPRHGDVVIVQRRRADLVESTCKAFVERKDGYWLEPRSTDTSLKPIFLGSPETQDHGDNEDEVVVHSLVTSVHLEL